MNINDTLHGFVVREVRQLDELSAVFYRMEHSKTRAQLVWLDRDDDNKTFSITFKTIPQDDTGVFHILEHSVLCGSEKYPVKEPFVELLKSSLQTFLNAFTFPDKTMYPVCSRNDQDFLNLIDVYMDAVLHPLSLNSPLPFRQEGWHYELDSAEGELRCNGVVYNEMKGAFGDPDELLNTELDRMLFPDNCYGYVSGGHPEHITDLTYESYLENHHRFYHPSNSRIFLDGAMDIDAVLSKLDGFLKEYDYLKVDAEIPFQQPVSGERTISYEIGADEDETDKALVAGGWVFGSYEDQDKQLACTLLTDLLCASNESPLKKALLSEGLCQDVELSTLDSIQQLYVLLIVRNTSEEKKERIWQVISDTLRGLADNGLDHAQLHSLLNHLEFLTREKDFGRMPKGLAYAISSMDSWLYGGDPARSLCFADLFRSMQEKIDNGWFEAFLRETFLENPHHARLLMLPSKTLGEEKRHKEQERLDSIRATWTNDDISQVMKEFKELRALQESVDTPEQLATLPQLSLSDIPESAAPIPQTITEVDGVTVLRQPIATDGITYWGLYFSLADLPLADMSKLSFFSSLLGDLETASYSPIELRREIHANLGRLSVFPVVFAQFGDTGVCTPYLKVSVAALESKAEEVRRLCHEVLFHTRFEDHEMMFHLLRQYRLTLEQKIMSKGNTYAARRVQSSCSAVGAVREALEGIDLLRWLQRAEKAFEGGDTGLCEEFASLLNRLFTRERLTISITGKAENSDLSAVIADLPSAPMGETVRYQPAPHRREGFRIPSDVSYTASGTNLALVNAQDSGAARVATQFLTYGYLWNTVRVKGGAYGTGLRCSTEGNISFTSFRDPSPAQTLTCTGGAVEALRELSDSGEPLDRYIISTIADLQSYMTPRAAGVRAASLYFTGRTEVESQNLRRQVLRTTPEQLRAVSDTLEKVCEAPSICVIGGADGLNACADLLDQVEALQQ